MSISIGRQQTANVDAHNQKLAEALREEKLSDAKNNIPPTLLIGIGGIEELLKTHFTILWGLRNRV